MFHHASNLLNMDQFSEKLENKHETSENLKMLGCATYQDSLLLATLRY